MPFGLRWASGCSPAPAPGPRSHETQAASHGLAPSFRVPRASSGRRAHRLPRGQTVQTRRLPSLRFSSPTASPRSWQQRDGRVCLTRPLAPSGFLDLSAPSSASSLPALFHAGSAHGVRPSERCSSRAAVRRLRRRCPPAVATTAQPSRGPPSCRRCRSTAPDPTTPIVGRPSCRPSSSGLCSTRESATSRRLFRPERARGSPGLRPLQGVPPRRQGIGLRHASPHAVPVPGDESTGRGRCRVSLPGEIGWSLSRLPTLMGFATS
jgi:hypothetical protein